MAVLDISKRIGVINSLLGENTAQSLTYAALECRLTLEYLCYERFKNYYSYLSSEDIKSWQPKHVVKQVSEDIDENINKGLTVSICRHNEDDKLPVSKEDFESLEYTLVGQQPELNLNKLHSLWHGLANIALHIPVPSIFSGELEIYGEKEKIKKKVEAVIDYLSGLKGNLLMGGPLGKSFSFKCVMCESLIKKPFKYLNLPSVVNCINPECNESYLLEPEDNGAEFKITRRIFKFGCKVCNCDIHVASNVFRELKFDQQLNIRCGSCEAFLTVVMRPLIKINED
jgi:hypothetical protein